RDTYLVEGKFKLPDNGFSGLSRVQASGAALEKRRAYVALDIAKHKTYRGLRNTQSIGGGSHVAPPGKLDQRLETAGIHLQHVQPAATCAAGKYRHVTIGGIHIGEGPFNPM